MAWEDRTPEQQAEAERAAAEYAATDDDKTYEVTTGGGTKLTVTGINSARVVAGSTGTFREVAP